MLLILTQWSISSEGSRFRIGCTCDTYFIRTIMGGKKYGGAISNFMLFFSTLGIVFFHSFSVSKTILLLSSCSLIPAYDRHSAPGKMGRGIFLSAAAPHSKLLANSITHHIISTIDECVLNFHKCSEYASSTNTEGSYKCSSNPEFSGDGVKDNNP